MPKVHLYLALIALFLVKANPSNASQPISTFRQNNQQSAILPTATSTVIPSTPNANGSIIHIVKQGETIWAIAQAYGISEADIRRINNLSSNIIFPDQQLLIRPADTPTPTPATPTPTRRPTSTPWPTSTATSTNAPAAIPATPTYQLPATAGLGIVLLIAVIAIGLAAAITLAGARARDK